MSGIPWTPEEEAYLRQAYSRVGAKKIAKRLGRSVHAVRTRACLLWIPHGESTASTRKHMLIQEVAAASGTRDTTVYRVAKAADAIIGNAPGGWRRCYIDAVWAAAYIARKKEEAENEHNYVHYWTSDQAAEFLGTGVRQLGNGLLRNHGIFRHYAHMFRFVRGYKQRLLFDPNSVRRVAVAMRENERRAA